MNVSFAVIFFLKVIIRYRHADANTQNVFLLVDHINNNSFSFATFYQRFDDVHFFFLQPHRAEWWHYYYARKLKEEVRDSSPY